MLINAYLNVTAKQWEEIKEKYVEPNMYHTVKTTKRVHKRCDDCGAYCPCTSYEGYCLSAEELVDACDTCSEWHE